MLSIDNLKQMFPDFDINVKRDYNIIQVHPEDRKIRLKKYGIKKFNRLEQTLKSYVSEYYPDPDTQIELMLYDRGLTIRKAIILMDSKHYEIIGTHIIIINNIAYIFEYKESKI